MDPNEIQKLLQQKSQELGQSGANAPVMADTSSDAEIQNLRGQQTEKIKQLFAHDTQLADTYFQPQAASAVAGETVAQPAARLIDPTIGMRASSAQTQATASELGDILTKIAARKDDLRDTYEKGMKIYELGLQAKEKEAKFLEVLLGDAREKERFEYDKTEDEKARIEADKDRELERAEIAAADAKDKEIKKAEAKSDIAGDIETESSKPADQRLTKEEFIARAIAVNEGYMTPDEVRAYVERIWPQAWVEAEKKQKETKAKQEESKTWWKNWGNNLWDRKTEEEERTRKQLQDFWKSYGNQIQDVGDIFTFGKYSAQDKASSNKK